MFELAREEIRDERLGRWIRRVVHDEAVRPEHRVQYPAERLGDVAARAHTPPARSPEPSGVNSVARQAPGTCPSSASTIPSRPLQRSDGPVSGAIGRGGLDRCDVQLPVENRASAHLFPVMVLGVDPEHGDDRDAVLPRHLLREPDRRGRLEQRERRPTEQARLLPGHDGDGPRHPRAPRGGHASGGAPRRSCCASHDVGDVAAGRG